MELPGFKYQPELISIEEAESLLDNIRNLRFCHIRMHGVIARRRVIHYGWDYGYDSWKITPTLPIPDFLSPLRRIAAGFAGVDPSALEEVLVTEYPPGAGIGWHRDAPMFGLVVGVSLVGYCRFRFRRGPGHKALIDHILEPRSAYVLDGQARHEWQHSISPVKQLRYSIAFRTLGKADGSAA